MLEDSMESSPFLEAYLEGTSGMVGSLLVIPFLYIWRMRIALCTSWALGIFGAIMLTFYHWHIIPPETWAPFMREPNPYPEGSKEWVEYYETAYIVFWVWFIKVAMNMAYQCLYMDSFCENFVFCYFKRVTAVGFSNLFARIAIVFSPMVAE